MVSKLTTFGNDLYTGKKSFDFIGKRKLWYTVASIMMILSVIIPVVKGGFNFSIEFSGGSQFQITNVANTDQSKAQEAVRSVAPQAVVFVTVVNDNAVRVQTDTLGENETQQVAEALAQAYDVDRNEVASTFIGPTWGADVTRQSLQGLVVFLVLAFLAMALYFRTWKMSLAAIIGLIHVLIVSIGVYALVGFEISPATVIGFLTILGYSLYDIVVVFDKIRENTQEDKGSTKRTFSESVNLAVNQTLVRCINTSIVAVLPVASILFIGAFALGAGTLRDISLSLLVGIIVATYSTIFICAPLYAHLRIKEEGIAKSDKKILTVREKMNASVSSTV